MIDPRLALSNEVLTKIYTVSQTDGDNFVKTSPIFKILSPLERGVNYKQNPYSITHHTPSMLPHYLWKVKSSNLRQITNVITTDFRLWLVSTNYGAI